MHAASEAPPYRFTAGRWVSGDQFLGRRNLLDDAWRCLVQADGFQARRYLGRRRQGKTSMLQAIHRIASTLDARKAPEGPMPTGDPEAWDLDGWLRWRMAQPDAANLEERRLVPVMLDLRANRDARSMSVRVAQTVQRPLGIDKLARRVAQAERPWDALLGELQSASWDDAFSLVLLADEAEALAPSEDDLASRPELADEARAACERLEKLVEQGDFPVQVFIASPRSLDVRATGLLRTLLDSIPVFALGNLSEPAVDTMLSRAELSDEQASELRTACGGHPFFLHVRGFGMQHPEADPDLQIAAGIDNDLRHLTASEQGWLATLARGERAEVPASVELLRRLDYIVAVEDGWRMREPVLADWLRKEVVAASPEPVVPALEEQAIKARVELVAPGADAAGESGVITLALRSEAKPAKQRFGSLKVSGVQTMNLGSQRYLLLYLLAARSQADSEIRLHDRELRYVMYLSLALCGHRHGQLNLRRVISALRSEVADGPVSDGGPRPSRRWLPPGRGGYSLGEEIVVTHADPPMGHLPAGKVDLLRAAQVWQRNVARFDEFLRDAVVNQTPGRSIRLEVHRAEIGLFPNHDAVLKILVTEGGTREVAVLGPIPLRHEQADGLAVWAGHHMDEEWVPGREKGSSDAAKAARLSEALEALDLRGGAFSSGGRRWSTEWAPAPGTERGFATAPRWLDLHLEDARDSKTFGVEELVADLGGGEGAV